jgi:hypothetical protein
MHCGMSTQNSANPPGSPHVKFKLDGNCLLETGSAAIPGGGWRREFAADQVERARLIKALHRKGVALSRLARANLTFDGAQAFVIFDGHELHAMPGRGGDRRRGAGKALVLGNRSGCDPHGNCGHGSRSSGSP